MLVIDDIRRYCFALITAPPTESPDESIALNDTEFLGTAFYVAQNGLALTAGHNLPSPDDLKGRTLRGIHWDGEKPVAHTVVWSLKPDGIDVGLLRLGGVKSQYLETDFRRVYMGEDVAATGIPDEGPWEHGRDFRLFKGHVTRSRHNLELSFAAPRGLSGGPVLCDGKVIGIIIRNHRSEALEDQFTEIEEIEPGKVRETRLETKAIINYGLAAPLHLLADFRHEFFKGDTLPEVIAKTIASHDGEPDPESAEYT